MVGCKGFQNDQKKKHHVSNQVQNHQKHRNQNIRHDTNPEELYHLGCPPSQ